VSDRSDADPPGAGDRAWQPGAHKGAQLVNETGRLRDDALMTTDPDEAKRFYTESSPGASRPSRWARTRW